MPQFVHDHDSSGAALVACTMLATIRTRTFHDVVLPLVLLTIVRDTLAISDLIG